jgi:uncharacterized protein YbjT (DUF2867 family)
VDLAVGDLTRPETLGPAIEGIEAIVFTHGSTTSERDVRDNYYAGVANVLKTLDGRPVRIALMTAIGITRPGVPYTQWKLRSERLVRGSGNPYTIVRPGWFDSNQPNQRKIVMLQGDKRQSGSPKDGVIARDQIARVLIDGLHMEAAEHKTLELIAEDGTEQEDLTSLFASLTPDTSESLDGAEDTVDLPVSNEPETFRSDLATIAAGNVTPERGLRAGFPDDAVLYYVNSGHGRSVKLLAVVPGDQVLANPIPTWR